MKLLIRSTILIDVPDNTSDEEVAFVLRTMAQDVELNLLAARDRFEIEKDELIFLGTSCEKLYA